MAALNGRNSDPNMHIIQEITEEDRYLLNLVDTIPAKVYFNQAIQEKIKFDKHLKMDQKAENADHICRSPALKGFSLCDLY
ncbi:UNVERIFIED_CONTAM: hypothetical protein NCL1_57562 [Trichonephila clavipes]